MTQQPPHSDTHSDQQEPSADAAAKQRASRRKKRWLIGCTTPVVVLAVVAAGVGHIYGPSMIGMTTGTVRYLLPPSPQKYAADAIRIIDSIAIDASSAEYAAAKQREADEIATAENYGDLAAPLDNILKAAGGKHSKFLTPAENEPSTESNSTAPTGRAFGDVGVVKLPEVTTGFYGQIYADRVSEGLFAHAKCGAVVDLRGNGGGDMGPMVAGLSPLLPDGVALTFVGGRFNTDVVVNGNSVQGGGTATSTKGGKLDIPVAILIDEHTASSAEATLLAFRGLDYARSFGTPTAGYASANMLINLSDGAGLQVTVAKDKARTGEVFNDEPIAPDVLVGASPTTSTDDATGNAAEAAQAANTAKDATLDAALAWLAEQGCTASPTQNQNLYHPNG